MVLRTADAIQSNMQKKDGKSGYKLSNSAVYVHLNTTVLAKPTLIALPLFSDLMMDVESNRAWYTIKYDDIKGY